MSISAISENEFTEYSVSDRLIECFIDDWNEENPKSKLHPGFIDLLKFYIRLAYIAGWDDHRILVDEILNRPGNSSKDGKISKHFFKALLEDLQNRV